MGHVASALVGVLTFVLAVLAIAEQFGFIQASVLGGLTTGNLGVFVVVGIIASLGLYVVEDGHSSPRSLRELRFGNGKRRR